MNQIDEDSEVRARPDPTLKIRRALKIAAIIFSLVVGGIVVTAVFSGDQIDLPFDYEGFD